MEEIFGEGDPIYSPTSINSNVPRAAALPELSQAYRWNFFYSFLILHGARICEYRSELAQHAAHRSSCTRSQVPASSSAANAGTVLITTSFHEPHFIGGNGSVKINIVL